MIDHIGRIENLLEAWGKVVRGDLSKLKRVTVAQSRYGDVTGPVDIDSDTLIAVIDPRGEKSYFTIGEIEMAAKVIGGLDDVYRHPIEARYRFSASKEDRAAMLGVSARTFQSRLVDAKVAFGIKWNHIKHNVKQAGVRINFNENY